MSQLNAGQTRITAGDIIIVPYILQEIKDLVIEENINEHGRLYLSGNIYEEETDNYIFTTKIGTNIKVGTIKEEGQKDIFFNGIVTEINIEAVDKVYYIQIEALTYTYLLDIELKSASYQDKTKTYEQLIKEITYKHPQAGVIDRATNKAETGEFIMQYKETDWQFIKRLASRFNAGLVPAIERDEAAYYFGIPLRDAGEIHCFNYSIKKDIASHMISSANYIEELMTIDSICYAIETEKHLKIGNRITFDNKTLCVSAIKRYLKNSLLKNKYILKTEKGLSQNKFNNPKLSGLSIDGRVIDIAGDMVKIHLYTTDNNTQDLNTACWFLYSTIYSSADGSGWYCMPELNDNVRIYFPDDYDNNAYAASSTHQQPAIKSFRSNPDVKALRSKYGKEIAMHPGGISITAQDGTTFITLNDNGGIELNSNRPISFISSENINIDAAKDINVNGQQGINIVQNDGSKVEVNSSVNLTGQEVNNN